MIDSSWRLVPVCVWSGEAVVVAAVLEESWQIGGVVGHPEQLKVIAANNGVLSIAIEKSVYGKASLLYLLAVDDLMI